MCMILQDFATAPTEPKTVFKMLRYIDGLWHSPFYYGFEFRVGVNEAEGEVDIRVSTHQEQNQMIRREFLHGGAFHCYTDYHAARGLQQYANSYRRDNVVKIAVMTGMPEDYVATGVAGEIAFKKLHWDGTFYGE